MKELGTNIYYYGKNQTEYYNKTIKYLIDYIDWIYNKNIKN